MVTISSTIVVLVNSSEPIYIYVEGCLVADEDPTIGMVKMAFIGDSLGSSGVA